MVKSITNSELRKMLKEGTVKFLFTKKDGSVRTAVGTMKDSLITKKPGGGICYPKEVGYSLYFDLEKDNWRVYDENKIIGVVES